MAIALPILFAVLLLSPSWATAKDDVHGVLMQAAGELNRGRPAEAEELLEPLKVPSVWGFWRAALLAQAKLDQGKPQKAQEALDLLGGSLPSPPRDLVNRNQHFYRNLYRDALETGLKASERLAKPTETWKVRLWTYFPDFESVPPAGVRTEDKVARLHLLFEKSLFESVPTLISVAEIAGAHLPKDVRCRALFEWGYAQQKLKKKEKALEGYDRLARSSCEGTLLTRALYWKGSLEAELKRDSAAEDTFKRLAKISSAGGGRYEDDAYDRLYRLYQSQNDAEKAEWALKELTGLKRGDMKEKRLWEEGFGAYQRGDYEKALGFFNQIIETEPLGTEAQPQALYWKARTQEIPATKRGGGTPAWATYRKILKDYPFSFYAVLAEARLGESAAVPAFVNSKPGVNSKSGLVADGDGAEAFRTVDRLNRKGDRDAAADLLDYLTQLNPRLIRERSDWIAQYWMESGDYHRALELAADRLGRSAFDIDLDGNDPLTRALYPMGYLREARRAAETNDVPTALILGIMREESLFLPAVRSRAGAVGVMQLMPATARLKARSLGIPHSYGDLSDPSSNIALGSSYLHEMLGRFGGQTALAVMAYNAGPGNVAKWLRNQGNLPLDEFIESTPLSETRGYVKRVLRSAHIYGHLLAKQTRLLASLEPPRF